MTPGVEETVPAPVAGSAPVGGAGRRLTIGVAMSVHNEAALIDQTLASVAGQSRLPDEVVLVDDGSTDDTADRAERWADRLAVTVVRQFPNAGMWSGRNAAVSALRTELVQFLDGDDIWLPDHLAVMEEGYRRSPGIIAATYLSWIPGRGVSRRTSAEVRPVPADDQSAALLVENYVPSGSLCRRTDLEAVGGFRRFQGPEDWDLWIRLLRRGLRVTSSAGPTMLYRVRPASLSRQPRFLGEVIAVLERVLEEEEDPRLRRIAARALLEKQARVRLETAHTYVREGRTSAARWRALGALRGGRPRTAAHAAALAVAPRSTVRALESPTYRRGRVLGRPAPKAER